MRKIKPKRGWIAIGREDAAITGRVIHCRRCGQQLRHALRVVHPKRRKVFFVGRICAERLAKSRS